MPLLTAHLFVFYFGVVSDLTPPTAVSCYVAGGIAPKLQARLGDGRFLASFRAKGRLAPVLARIPVKLVLNERTALLGAALLASRQAAPVT